MNQSLEDLNQKKILDILRAIWEDNHRFTDIHKEVGWSKATVSKYLQALQSEQVIEKSLTSGEKVGYFFTEEGEALFSNQNLAETLQYNLEKEDLVEHAKKRNKLLEDLKEENLFSEGMDMQGVKQIVEKYPEEFSSEFSGKLDAKLYRQFILFLVRMFEPKIWDKQIEANIKIKEENPESLKVDVEELKDSMDEFDWPV